MRINEIIKESYADDLIDVVRDLLSVIISKDVKKVSTEKFKSLLAKQGFVVSTDEVITAVDASGFARSVNSQEIVPGDEMGDIENDDTGVNVDDLAGSQAIKDIKSEL